MEKRITVKENGLYKVVKTKNIIHYLNKLEEELEKSLGENKGDMTYGALRTLWYTDFYDKEDIRNFIQWEKAQLCIVDIAGLIKKSTYEGIKEELNKLRLDIRDMPI